MKKLSTAQIEAISLDFLKSKKRTYTSLEPQNKFQFQTDELFIFGEFEGQKKDTYSVGYGVFWGLEEVSYFLCIDAYTGEVYYTVTPHGFVEEWE